MVKILLPPSGGGGGATDLNGLSDVSLSGVAQGDGLFYNGTTWTNIGIGNIGEVLTVNALGNFPEWQTPATPSLALSELTDTSISRGAVGDILAFNGTNWVNVGAGGVGDILTSQDTFALPTWTAPVRELQQLDDVIPGTLVPGLMLYYNGSDWVSVTPGTNGQVLTYNGVTNTPEWV